MDKANYRHRNGNDVYSTRKTCTYTVSTLVSIFTQLQSKFYREMPITGISLSKIVNEYDQEIPQSQTADNPVAP